MKKKKKLSKRKQKILTLRAKTASAVTLSNSANWSPMHLRFPPPKGRYENDSVISLGTTYEDEDEAEAEAADAALPLLPLRGHPGSAFTAATSSTGPNRSGTKSSASFHLPGSRWRFQTLRKRSEPAGIA